MRWTCLVGAIVFASGCLHDTLQACGDLLCPADSICMTGACVPRAAVTACEGMSDGHACSIAALPAGVCGGGVCVAAGCGNHVVEPDEICDDGNTKDGDGCSADCLSRDTCPPIGMTPRFSALVHQPIVQVCNDYTTTRASTNLGIATCFDSSGGGIAIGPIDGQLTFIPSLVDSGDPRRHPSIAPDGTELFMVHQPTLSTNEIVAYHPVFGSNDWNFAYALTGLPTSEVLLIGTPSLGLPRHMMVILDDNKLHEYVLSSTGTMTEVGDYTSQALNVLNLFTRPNLTPDGLRLVFTGYDDTSLRLFFTDRPTIDDRFRPAEPLSGVPPTGDGFMTDTCARIYFSAISSVFYVQQQ